ncbi:MAG TPA: sigma-54 dependent transcriptional regulator [Terriglobia bacterium]|nr:sigma-54 dependent transcriptional regulator [Terriglobia bacterium]
MTMKPNKDARVLVVDDETHEREGLATLLRNWGYETETASQGREALEKIPSFNPVVVVCDLRMPDMGGMELLRELGNSRPSLSFIMLSGQGTIEEAVEATKLGAFNFLEKPLDVKKLQVELRNCLERRLNERELEIAHRRLREAGILGSLIGRSKKMQEVMSLVAQVAPSSASVLITGESGTGKELAARTIHDLSPRRMNPFVAVNCAAIPESLMESEIFGHEKGAFTGAMDRRAGCFELADGGTLLLDEIGEMPVGTQAKLLRVLEDSKVRRLGSKAEILTDVRVLAATNKMPEDAVAKGQLRSDLYFRLNVVHLPMPPLREHLEDLEPLIEQLLQDLNQKHQKNVRVLDQEVLEVFRRHTWPGNVRELRNTLERAVVVCSGEVLRKADLGPEFGRTAPAVVDGDLAIRPGLTVSEVERLLIRETLTFTNNNKTRAAEILGISLKTLHNKLKEYESQP